MSVMPVPVAVSAPAVPVPFCTTNDRACGRSDRGTLSGAADNGSCDGTCSGTDGCSPQGTSRPVMRMTG